MIVAAILVGVVYGCLIGATLTLLTAYCWKFVCERRQQPFKPSLKRWCLAWFLTSASIVAVWTFIFAKDFWTPQEKTFTCPNGDYLVTVAFYTSGWESFRCVMTLREARTMETVGSKETIIRDIFVGDFGDGVNWGIALYVEWDQREGASDKVRVVYPEMNTAILLPSGTRVFPISELEPLAVSGDLREAAELPVESGE